MKYALALLVGLIGGGLLVYLLLVGPQRLEKPPGELVRAPEAGGDPPGTAVLTLDEGFFGALFDTIFRDMSAPTFKLASRDESAPLLRPLANQETDVRFVKTQGGCANQVIVAQEGSGVRTGVRLTDGQMLAPLAFSGSYNAFGNCLNFKGWAQANIQLSFKQDEQTLYGQINVEGVNLEGVPPFVGGVVTQFVQNAINQRVNPLVMMRGAQLALSVPVQATGGTLKAQAREIRSEIKDGALRLHVTYDFNASGGPQQPSPPPVQPTPQS